MQPKKNLNNQQRKMLDEIYSEQFNAKKAVILNKRSEELSTLKLQVVDEVSNTRKAKALVEAGKRFYELLQTTGKELAEVGIHINEKVSGVPILGLQRYSYSSTVDATHPKLLAHQERTRQIEAELAEKKQLIRSAIYGMATDFNDVKAEIEAVLADIKI